MLLGAPFWVMTTQHSIEITGASVEEAISEGLKKLNADPSQVIVEVLEEPSRGLFGLGSRVARVRLQLLAPPAPPPSSSSAPAATPISTPISTPIEDEVVVPSTPISDPTYHGDDDDFFDEDGSYQEPEPPPAPKPEKRQKQSDEGRSSGSRSGKSSRGGRRSSSRNNRDSEQGESGGKSSRGGRRSSSRGRGGKREESNVITPPVVFEEGADELGISEQVLVELFDLMDVPVSIESTRAEVGDGDEGEPPWVLNIAGDDEHLNDLVGRRGDTLSSLQYLTRLIVSKQTESRANIVIDVNGYRGERSEKLRRLAMRMADQAVETARTVIMEPMPPHERRIIHMVLRQRDDVQTESAGQGDSRRVTIIPNNLETPQI